MIIVVFFLNENWKYCGIVCYKFLWFGYLINGESLVFIVIIYVRNIFEMVEIDILKW